MNAQRLLLPAWLATLLTGLVALAIDLLLGVDGKLALVGFLTLLPTVYGGQRIARERALEDVRSLAPPDT